MKTSHRKSISPVKFSSATDNLFYKTEYVASMEECVYFIHTFVVLRKRKTLSIKDLVVEQDIDCLAITETWLRSGDADVINEVCPSGYDFCHITF